MSYTVVEYIIHIFFLHLKCVFDNILLISFIFNIKFMFCICFIIIIIDLILTTSQNTREAVDHPTILVYEYSDFLNIFLQT
jgi:hypothetical protein